MTNEFHEGMNGLLMRIAAGIDRAEADGRPLFDYSMGVPRTGWPPIVKDSAHTLPAHDKRRP